MPGHHTSKGIHGSHHVTTHIKPPYYELVDFEIALEANASGLVRVPTYAAPTTYSICLPDLWCRRSRMPRNWECVRLDHCPSGVKAGRSPVVEVSSQSGSGKRERRCPPRPAPHLSSARFADSRGRYVRDQRGVVYLHPLKELARLISYAQS